MENAQFYAGRGRKTAYVCIYKYRKAFLGAPVAKKLPCNAGDTGSTPGLGRFQLPRDNRAGVPQLLKPMRPRAHRPQEKPLQLA